MTFRLRLTSKQREQKSDAEFWDDEAWYFKWLGISMIVICGTMLAALIATVLLLWVEYP